MIRYYFHIRDGLDFIPDEEGMELSGMDAARSEAYASAGDLARDATREGSILSAVAIEIADHYGNVLDRVKVPERRLA